VTAHIGLYYPYIHFRNEAWLKVAALYWPTMGRIVPVGYRLEDSLTARRLADDLDFVLNVDPAPAIADTTSVMLEAVTDHVDALRDRYDIADATVGRRTAGGGTSNGEVWQVAAAPPPSRWTPPIGSETSDQVLAHLHTDKTSEALRSALRAAALATPVSGQWLGTHPQVAWVYMCVLAERLAVRNRLAPTTDQSAAHLATHGWTADRVAAALLDQDEPALGGDVSAPRIGMLAVQLAVPANPVDIPVEKIIKARRRYCADFDAFHDEIIAAAADLTTELASIQNQTVLDAYLNREVASRFRRPVEHLRAAMRGVGIDTVLTAANLKFELPAALVPAVGALLAGQPLIAGTTAAAFGLLTVGRSVRSRRAELATPSAASYLWNVKRTTARSLLDRLMR
jgi:hypothetical protein